MPRVGFVSLGCPKATVDSERILTQLRAEGYQMVGDYAGADLVVVNTCGFIDAAVEESLEAIGEALEANGRVVVTGCLGAKEQGEFIRKAHPQVLAVTGPQENSQVMEAIHAALPPAHDPYTDLVPPQGLRLTPAHYAYLKISEGCNQSCSFCIIPSMRGKLVSRNPDAILQEAENLVASGVQELLVISQDTGAYGVDRKYRTAFHQGRPLKTRITDLCAALGQLGVWVRLHYVYPYPHIDELLPLMAEGKVLPYLDVPLQHGSPRILKAMRRPAAADRTLQRIQAWRAAELDRVGCFAYSPVAGAAANDLPDPVPEALREERRERFLELQQEISAQRLRRWLGREREVLIDELLPNGEAVGRSASDAPEIDGIVQVRGLTQGRVGARLRVLIREADAYDLSGDAIAPA